MAQLFEEYFKDATIEDLKDAQLLHPLQITWRNVPQLIDPSPTIFSRTFGSFIPVVEEGTGVPIDSYAIESEDRLRKLFNQLYEDKDKETERCFGLFVNRLMHLLQNL